MKFKFAHNNFNVTDLDRSLRFYEEALGLKEVRRKEAEDGSFIIVYLGDGETGHLLELTSETGRRTTTTWETMNSTWHLRWTILKRPMQSTRKWAASALKTKKWGSILSQIPMNTGWRSCQ